MTRPQLPKLREDSSPAERVALGASTALRDLDELITHLRRVGLHAQADRVEVARAIVHKECSAVVARTTAWRDESTAELEVSDGR